MGKVLKTSHARKRQQQRGINDKVIELIQFFGELKYQSGGEQIGYITDKTLSDLRTAIDRAKGVAIVTNGEGRVITAMHQTRRIRVKGNA